MFWNKKNNIAAGPASLPARAPLALSLEPRMMFDGAIAATVADTAMTVADAAQTQSADSGNDTPTPPAASSDQRQEIVFVDGKVQDYQQLVSEIKPGTEVVVLDGTRDGLQQIADYLKGREGIDAIHILSHGTEAQLQLGSLALDRSNLASHANSLAAIGESLSDGGDILLYGCNIGQGDAGQNFIERLAQLTQADVAASTDATGSAAVGGNWMLEAATGGIETMLPFSQAAQVQFSGRLFAGTITFSGSSSDLGTSVTDGEGNSTDIPGVTIELYAAGSSGNNLNRTWMLNDNLGTGVGVTTGQREDHFVLRSTGGENFAFQGIRLIEVGAMGGSYGFSAYRDGDLVGSVSLPFSSPVVVNDFGTDRFSAATFGNVDEIRISTSAGSQVGLNNIVIADAILPNTAPTASNLSQSLTAVEGWNAVALGDIVITDPDASDILTATLTLSSPAAGALSTGTFGSAISSYNPGMGVWSVTGSRTDVNAALAAVALTPSADNDQNFTITTRIRDAANSGPADGIISISVTGVNDVPSATNLNQSKAVTEGGGAVALDDIVVSDPDTGDTITATLTLSSPAAGSLSTGTFGVAASTYDAGTGVWSVSGSRTDVNAALAAVALTPSADNEQNFTITTRIRDAANSGPADGIISVSVTAVNDAPVVSTSGGGSSFIENAGGSVIDAGLTLSDVDNATLASARVAITGNFASGQDVLAFVNDSSMGNISASYDAGTGVLTLTSAGATATLAQWEAALRSVTYSNGSDAPSTATRTISFRVNDGTADSNHATKVLNVTAVNDAPQITAPATLSVTEDQASVLTGISFSDPDAAAGLITASFSVSSGMLIATNDMGVTVLGSGSGSLTITGTLANVNAFIAGNNLSFTTAANATANVTLSIGINDEGNTGSGSAATDSQTVTLQVTAVNDAPLITAPLAIHVTEDVSSALTYISFADIDAGINSVTATFSVPSGTLSATTALGVNVGGSGTGLLTLTGALSDINFFIAAQNLTFRTAQDATASVILTVNISDGGFSGSGSGGALTDTKTVLLTVTEVNDAPVNSLPAAQSVNQDATLVFSSGNGNLISISDVDAGTGILSVTLVASYGQLSLASTSGLTFSTGDGSNDGVMTFNGTLIHINNALNGLSYSPATGYNGPAGLQISTSDLGLSGSGSAQVDTDTIQITVNPINPVITAISSSNADGTYKVGDVITISTTFDQVVTVDTNGGIPSLLLETGLTDRIATYVSGSGSNTLTFSYTVQTGDSSADLDYVSTSALSLNGGTILNAASQDAVLTLPASGGASSIAGQHDLVIDGVAPIVTSVWVPPNATHVAGENLDFTVNFSEAITVDTNGGTPRLAITLDTGGTVYASYLSGSGSNALVFRHTLDNGVQDSNGISLGNSIDANGGTLRDVAGNDTTTTLNTVGSTTGVLVDAVAPEVSAISLDGASPTNATSVTFTVTFSEDVSGVDINDFSLITSGSVNATLQSLVQIDPRTYQVTVDAITGLGSLGLNLNANGTGIVDTANNAVAGGFTDGPAYAIDTNAPTAPVVTSPALTNAPTPMLSGTAEADSTVTVTIGGATYTTVASDGAWSLDLTTATPAAGSLALNTNGANPVSVTATDAAGNVSSAGSQTLVIDTTAPTTPAVTSPTLTNALAPVLSGTAEAGSTVTVTIGGATYTTVASGGAWSLDLATATPAAGSLALNTNGANPVSVTATDTAGNVSSATTQTLVIDTTAPTTPAVTSPTLTNAPTPMLSGTAEAGSTVTVTIGGATYTTVASGGAWSLDLTTATPAAGSLALNTNGANPVSVTATDTAGNVSSAGSQTLVIDTTAPTTPAVTSPALTNALAPVLSGTAEAGSTVTVTIGGATYTTVASGGAWSLDLATATPAAGSLALNTNGANPVSVTATDTAGNVSSAGSQTLIIDTQAPTIGSVTVPVGVHYNAGDTLTFVVNASEAVLVNGTPRLALDVGGVTVFADYVAGSSTSTLVFQYSVQAGLNDADGITVVGLVDNGGSIQDAAGNVMDPTLNNVGDTSGVIIDTTAPSVSAIVTLDPSPTNAGSVRYSVVFSENVSGVDLADFSLVTTGNVAASLGSLVQIDSRTYQVTINGITGSGTLALALNASGTAIVDAAGNELATGLVGSAYSLGQNEGDPEFRANPPSHNVDIPSPPLQPTLPSLPPPPTTSPLLPPPLFEVPTLGSGIPTLGNIFITQNPLAPSYIAQVFASSDSGAGNGSGIGFLGFGGNDGGVFGTSSFSSVFSKDVPLESGDIQLRWGNSISNGLSGGEILGAPTLSQQLQEIGESEQRQIKDLAWALGKMPLQMPQA